MWTEGLLDLLEEGKGRNTQMYCCSFPPVKALQKDWDGFYWKERCPSFSFQKEVEILLETTEYARKFYARQAAGCEWRWQLERWKVCKELSCSCGLTLQGLENLWQPQSWEQITDPPDSGLAFYNSPSFRIELHSSWGQSSTNKGWEGLQDLRPQGFSHPNWTRPWANLPGRSAGLALSGSSTSSSSLTLSKGSQHESQQQRNPVSFCHCDSNPQYLQYGLSDFGSTVQCHFLLKRNEILMSRVGKVCSF